MACSCPFLVPPARSASLPSVTTTFRWGRRDRESSLGSPAYIERAGSARSSKATARTSSNQVRRVWEGLYTERAGSAPSSKATARTSSNQVRRVWEGLAFFQGNGANVVKSSALGMVGASLLPRQWRDPHPHLHPNPSPTHRSSRVCDQVLDVRACEAHCLQARASLRCIAIHYGVREARRFITIH